LELFAGRGELHSGVVHLLAQLGFLLLTGGEQRRKLGLACRGGPNTLTGLDAVEVALLRLSRRDSERTPV
jgi:hypothetical protein